MRRIGLLVMILGYICVQFPNIAAAAQEIALTLSVGPQQQVRVGNPVTFKGTATEGGISKPNVVVIIQGSYTKGVDTVIGDTGEAVTDTNGNYSLSMKVHRTSVFSAMITAPDGRIIGRSPGVKITVTKQFQSSTPFQPVETPPGGTILLRK
jgi:hypothetical protein